MGTKVWWKSTTLQGAVVEAFSLLTHWLGVPVVKDELDTAVASVLGLIGLVMVVVGRVKAKEEITVS